MGIIIMYITLLLTTTCCNCNCMLFYVLLPKCLIMVSQVQSKQSPKTDSAYLTAHSSKHITAGGMLIPPVKSKLEAVMGGAAPRNVLDSSAPSVMRGKEREKPKKKRPSSLRKVIKS